MDTKVVFSDRYIVQRYAHEVNIHRTAPYGILPVMAKPGTKKAFFDLLHKAIGVPAGRKTTVKDRVAGYTSKRTSRRTTAGASSKPRRASRG